MDCSPPGSSVHGILQARIMEWVAIPFSQGFPNPGIKPMSPTLQADSLLSEPPGKPQMNRFYLYFQLGFCFFWSATSASLRTISTGLVILCNSRRGAFLNTKVAQHQGKSQLLEFQQSLRVCSTKGRHVWRIRLPAVIFWKMSAIHICLTKKPLDGSERGE